MIHIKRFIDRVSMLESRQSKDFVMTISDARLLRDELSKILVDMVNLSNEAKNIEEPILKFEVRGSKF